MEERNSGGRKSKSVLYRPRPPKEFIDLLRSSTEFSFRSKKDGSREPQVRIGTSYKNSVAVPVKYLETLHAHIGEVLENRDDMVAKLDEENRTDDGELGDE